MYIKECSEPCQTVKTELFVELVKGWKPLTIYRKNRIFDVWQDSEYVW